FFSGRRRHTRFSRDWSSDVCSSDLKARQAGVIYSLAWGDQPALICEHVDWARACGFKVISAGKGTRYHPSYHRSNPDTVWDILEIGRASGREGGASGVGAWTVNKYT